MQRTIHVLSIAACAACAACALAAGCVEIQGGAVELSWSLRTFDGQPIAECRDARIEGMRIEWTPTTEGVSAGFDEFECVKSSGVTGFSIEPGSHLFTVRPICDDGALADDGTFEAPLPILRQVAVGSVVTLNSMLVVAADHSAEPQCAPGARCTCVRAP